MRYSEDPVLAAAGDPTAAHPRDRCPRLTQATRDFLAEAEDLNCALADLTHVFRVPVTNNIPWFEDGDPDRPVHHVGDFIEEIRAAFLRAGWTPPAAEAAPTTGDRS